MAAGDIPTRWLDWAGVARSAELHGLRERSPHATASPRPPMSSRTGRRGRRTLALAMVNAGGVSPASPRHFGRNVGSARRVPADGAGGPGHDPGHTAAVAINVSWNPIRAIAQIQPAGVRGGAGRDSRRRVASGVGAGFVLSCGHPVGRRDRFRRKPKPAGRGLVDGTLRAPRHFTGGDGDKHDGRGGGVPEKARARRLTIENYLVQVGGCSWAGAARRRPRGFPCKGGQGGPRGGTAVAHGASERFGRSTAAGGSCRASRPCLFPGPPQGYCTGLVRRSDTGPSSAVGRP